jgi:hypothetical protein
MSEFPAHQARELMLQKDKWNSEKWYTNFKDKFFKEIKNELLFRKLICDCVIFYKKK